MAKEWLTQQIPTDDHIDIDLIVTDEVNTLPSNVGIQNPDSDYWANRYTALQQESERQIKTLNDDINDEHAAWAILKQQNEEYRKRLDRLDGVLKKKEQRIHDLLDRVDELKLTISEPCTEDASAMKIYPPKDSVLGPDVLPQWVWRLLEDGDKIRQDDQILIQYAGSSNWVLASPSLIGKSYLIQSGAQYRRKLELTNPWETF